MGRQRYILLGWHGLLFVVKVAVTLTLVISRFILIVDHANRAPRLD